MPHTLRDQVWLAIGLAGGYLACRHLVKSTDAEPATAAAAAAAATFPAKPLLTYLDAASVVEVIRLTLVIGGIDFDDRRVSYEGVAALRKAGLLPHGQVPTLELPTGQRYAQSAAILRWAGKMAGMYPSQLQLQIDGVLELVNE